MARVYWTAGKDEDASDRDESSGVEDSENEGNDASAAVNNTETKSPAKNDRVVSSDGEERPNSCSDSSAPDGNKSDNNSSSAE